MIRKLFILLTLTLAMLASVLAFAQDKKAAQITGYLVDNMCVKGLDAKDKEHTVSCSLMPKCQKSGYSIVARDTAFKLDENGNKLALEVLKSTKQTQGLAVKVKGTVVEGILHVDELTEVPNQ
jgi:hypothetical protein